MKNFKLSICLLLISFLTFYCILPCFAEDTTYVWSSDLGLQSIETASEINSDANSLALESASAILIEQTTGQILYSHNIHERLMPASVTKVMSILLIMEALDSGKITLTDNVPCSENAASMGGSQIWLDPRETLTVDENVNLIKDVTNTSKDSKDVLK